MLFCSWIDGMISSPMSNIRPFGPLIFVKISHQFSQLSWDGGYLKTGITNAVLHDAVWNYKSNPELTFYCIKLSVQDFIYNFILYSMAEWIIIYISSKILHDVSPISNIYDWLVVTHYHCWLEQASVVNTRATRWDNFRCKSINLMKMGKKETASKQWPSIIGLCFQQYLILLIGGYPGL